MSKRKTLSQGSPSADLPSEFDEIAPAIRDVTYRLMHDLSDTPGDIRDAAALAPLALIKLAQQSGRFLGKRPKRTLLGLAFIPVVLAVIAKRRLSPRQ